MISVEAALEALFALARPTDAETVRLRDAGGRVLAEPAIARRAQPPFDASAMDGYALAAREAVAGATLRVIGTSAAGRRFDGRVGRGEAVRIFTGAPLPRGADRVIPQEDVRREGDAITLGDDPGAASFVRPAGGDFEAGMALGPGRRLAPRDIALLAAMDCATVAVHRRPAVAIVATGDELVPPGGGPGPDQIIASNGYGLAAMLEAEGALVRLLPIAPDDPGLLRQVLAMTEGADLVVTTGGASVGDHDLMARAAPELGLTLDFHKVAMRPGKPLMAGRLEGTPLIGLPGNPVSAMVCGAVFVAPVVRAIMGLPAAPAPAEGRRLTGPLGPNGPRAHYMRAQSRPDGGVEPADRQDSSLLQVLALADLLVLRPPNAPAAAPGDAVPCIRL